MDNINKIFTKTNINFLEALTETELSVRGLAEKNGVSPAKASQAVTVFLKNGLVNAKNNKNKKIISLNKVNILTREIIVLLFISKIIGSKTFKKIKRTAKAIGLYGSMANGTFDKLSDVDLWILGDKKASIYNLWEIKNSLSKELGKIVNIKTFTKEELIKIKQTDSIFFNEIKYKSKILFGENIE